jgi:glycosyltransferase involved in cell wall biosynthesis
MSLSAVTFASRQGRAASATTAEAAPTMVIVSPGGLSGGGGMGSVTRAMVHWLKQKPGQGRVFVIDPRGDGPAWFWPVRFLLAAIQLVWLRLAHRPRVLHLQVSERSSFLRKGALLLLGRMMGMKTVLHHHGAEVIPFFTGTAAPMRWLVRRAAALADMNIVLGERWRRFLMDEVGIDATKVTIVYNAAPDLGGSRIARRPGPMRFLLLANLSPRKGVGEFLRACALLVSEGRDIHATLAGGGDVRRYANEANALGLADRCTFTGWVGRERAETLIASSDALVLPSFDEGMPMAILEALSAGLPVIATPVGAIPEALSGERHALLTPPGDADALAAAMRRLMDDGELADHLRREGRRLYEERFQLDAYMARLVQLYAGLDRPRTTDPRRAG